MREEAFGEVIRNKTIQAVTWSIAGVRKITEAWDWLKHFDKIDLQETWTEEKDETKVMRVLDRNLKWHMKPAVRKNKKGRASGGQIVGFKKHMFKEVKIENWKEGLVIKGIKLGRNKEEFVLITIYKNFGFSELRQGTEKLINEAEGRGVGVIMMGDLNTRVGQEAGKLKDRRGERRKE